MGKTIIPRKKIIGGRIDDTLDDILKRSDAGSRLSKRQKDNLKRAILDRKDGKGLDVQESREIIANLYFEERRPTAAKRLASAKGMGIDSPKRKYLPVDKRTSSRIEAINKNLVDQKIARDKDFLSGQIHGSTDSESASGKPNNGTGFAKSKVKSRLY